MKDIDGLNGSLPFLFVPEHQVDPLTDVLGHVLGLQGLPVDEDKKARVVACPRREVDVIHPFTVLTDTEIKT